MKKKILVLIKNLDGGTGTFLWQIKKLEDFNFVICALEKPRYTPSNKKVLFFSNKPSYVGFYGLNPLLYISILKEFLWLKGIIKEERPAIVISIDTHCNVLVCLSELLNSKTKIITTTHNNISEVINRKINFLLRFLLKKIASIIFKRANAIICVSNGVGKDFSENFSINNKNIQIIPCGIDIKKTRTLASKPLPNKFEKLMRGGYKKIISVGRFEEQKDFTTLLKAFLKVHAVNENTRLYLIGDGSQRRLLENYVKKNNLTDSVFFLGWQKNVYLFLKNSDIFVLSSHYEGLPYVILEAMSVSLPLVLTDCSFGPYEILSGGKYGKLVPVGDVEKLSDALTDLISHPKELSKYSRMSELRIKSYSEEKMLNTYKNVLKRLINNYAIDNI